MDERIRRELRILKAYALIATAVIGTLSLAAFRQANQRTRFTEIDVERINVVEKNGTLRLTISNRERLPDPVIGGKAYPLRGGTGTGSAGLIFFNDEGNENGGLVYQGAATPNGHQASAHLTFDQFNQDETIALGYNGGGGRESSTLVFSDRPNVSIQAFAESAMVIRRMPDGPEKTKRMQEFRNSPAAAGGAGKQRLVLGKGGDKSSVVSLADREGRARLQLKVDSLGVASIEFLDAQGKVTSRFPEARR
jgi:hypothetical protein